MEDPKLGPAERPRLGLSRKAAASEGAATRESATDKTEGRPGERRPHATLDERMASLTTALRRARIENAEHSSAVADVRAAEIARLEALADALTPVVAQTPADVDIFDLAISPGERPRLFIDQIGFVEMDRDRRTYRFLQDTRHGRVTLCESADIDALVDASTTYMAHRLIEREQALAADYASGGAARLLKEKIAAARREQAQRDGGGDWIEPEIARSESKAFRFFLFIVEFLGSATFAGLLIALGFWAYHAYFAK